MTIRPAERGDLPDIGRIQGRPSWRPEDFLNFDCSVAVEGERVVGFVSSRQVGPGEREILFIAVDPAYRRRGIARKLLEYELGGSKGTWFLEVRESNVPALTLYRSMGFQPAGNRPNYYTDPPETAIVMRFFS